MTDLESIFCNSDKIDIIQKDIYNNLDDMTLKTYNLLALPGFKTTLQNLKDNSIYLDSYSLSYEGNENTFEGADVLGVGDPIKTEMGDDFVNIKYIGKVKLFGSFIAKFDLSKEVFIISDVLNTRGETITDSELKERIKNTITYQYSEFHSNQKSNWSSEWKWVFYDLEYVNGIKLDALYKKKILHKTSFDFAVNGSIVESSELAPYYEFSDGNIKAFYSSEKRCFINNENKVAYLSSNIKILILEFLLHSNGIDVLRSDMVKKLQITKESQRTSLQKLDDTIISLIINEFGKKLGFDPKFVKNHILMPLGGKTYKIVGKPLNEI